MPEAKGAPTITLIVALEAASEAGVEDRLVEQRVGHGDEQEIDVDQRRDVFERRREVDPHADRLDVAGLVSVPPAP